LAIGDGHFDAARTNTHVVAQKILNDKRGDLMVWGRVKSANALALYFTGRSTETSKASAYTLVSDAERALKSRTAGSASRPGASCKRWRRPADIGEGRGRTRLSCACRTAVQIEAEDRRTGGRLASVDPRAIEGEIDRIRSLGLDPQWLPCFLEAEVGMLIVEMIAKIRRAFFVQGKPIEAICR
jgi:hypothetical protein